jgi:hypothetical protein
VVLNSILNFQNLAKEGNKKKNYFGKKVSQAGVFLEGKNIKPINVLIST